MKPEQPDNCFKIGLSPGSVIGLICKECRYGFLKVGFPLQGLALIKPFFSGIKTDRAFAVYKDLIRIVS